MRELLSNPGHLAEVLHDMPGAKGDVLDRDPVAAVLVVDQFEEVVMLCSDEQHRQAFISALCDASAADAAGAPAALVILGTRADFTGRCAIYPGLVEPFRRGQVLLGPMTSAESREAIERPARAAGLEQESGLVDVVLADLGVGDFGELSHEAGALPLLAHALLSTWQQRDGTALTGAALTRGP